MNLELLILAGAELEAAQREVFTRLLLELSLRVNATTWRECVRLAKLTAECGQ